MSYSDGPQSRDASLKSPKSGRLPAGWSVPTLTQSTTSSSDSDDSDGIACPLDFDNIERIRESVSFSTGVEQLAINDYQGTRSLGTRRTPTSSLWPFEPACLRPSVPSGAQDM